MYEESQIIKEIIAGKKEKYDHIIEIYKDKLYAVALLLTASEEDAESIVKQGFKKAYEKLDTYEESFLFPEWLYDQFIPLFKEAGASSSITPLQLPLHNPHHIKLEEALHTMPYQLKLEFLLRRILQFSSTKISNLMDKRINEIEGRYKDSLINIRQYTLLDTHQEKGECHSIGELTEFHDGEVEEQVEEAIKDHLEFCPDCRNVLEGLKKEEVLLDFVLEFPKLGGAFNKKVLEDLVAYVPKQPKHRTWKYQFSVLGILCAIFLFGIFILPSLKPLAGMVTTYIQYGTIYNVWSEGTYVATDKEISFEVTEVEMDSDFMYIYYDIQREGEESPVSLFEEIDFYSHKPVKIIGEEDQEYEIQVTQPDYLRYGRKKVEDIEGEYRPFFVVKIKDKETLPDQFDIRINFVRLLDKYGNWKLDVPIRYDKMEDEAVTVKLNKEINIGNKMILEFVDVTYSKNITTFRYHQRQTEEERERVSSVLKEHNQEYRLQEYGLGHHIGLNVVTEGGNYVVPLYFYDMEMPDPDKPIEMYFTHYYTDTEFYDLKGKIKDPMRELFAKIMGVYYHEPAFFSMEIPLEETEKTLLDGRINEFKLTDYSIVATKDAAGDVSQYEFIINGESEAQDGITSEIGWEILDEKGEYVHTGGWYHYEDRDKDGPRKLFHGDIHPKYDHGSFPEKLLLKVESIYIQFNDLEGELFPLFIEEENEGGSDD